MENLLFGQNIFKTAIWVGFKMIMYMYSNCGIDLSTILQNDRVDGNNQARKRSVALPKNMNLIIWKKKMYAYYVVVLIILKYFIYSPLLNF